MSLIDELSRRGIQYGIYRDGRVRIFVGEQRLYVTEETLDEAQLLYEEALEKIRQDEVEKIRSDVAQASAERKIAGHRAYQYPRVSLSST